jgi:alpha-tubulin suppressor-like RCC1 family protein
MALLQRFVLPALIILSGLPASAQTLADALDQPMQAFTSSGDLPWVAQNATTCDGVDAIKSGAITHGQMSAISTTVTGPGTVSFWWRVSSENGYDYLRFSIDGTEKDRICGEVNWTQVSYTLIPGIHTLKWYYTKDTVISRGNDCGWVDQLVVPATSPQITTQPASQSILSGTTATLSVSASGTAPLSYQWYQGMSGAITSPIIGATSNSYTTPALTAPTTYWVRVTDSIGTADSSTVTVSMSISPTITTQPKSGTMIAGNRAVLSVTANGTAPLSYQWYQGTSGATTMPIGGATSAYYTTPELTATTSYWVRVNNSAGTTVSNTAIIAIAANALNCMGTNAYGQLGTGAGPSRSTPVQVANEAAVVSAGDRHTMFIKMDGTLWAMGANDYGQLGDGTTVNRNLPVQVASEVTRVEAGSDHSLFLKRDGTLWAMGRNHRGQFGDGTTSILSTPKQVASGVASMSVGYYHTMFVKTDGTLWATGYNNSGQLGDGTFVSRSTPVQVASGVSAVSAKAYQTLFVKTDGTLWAMGFNSAGQLGDGTTVSRSTPVWVASGVVSVSAGYVHTLFVKGDGTLWAMGYNYNGQLGDGTMTDRSTPKQVASGVAMVSAGNQHTLFVKTNGTLWAMGYNLAGELGDGTTTRRISPVQVASGVSTASAGNLHSMYLGTAIPPSITAQPHAQVINNGQTATLSVAASGFGLGYQWYQGASGTTTNPIDGATSVNFTTPALTAAASYWVRVSNEGGTVNSATASITVITPPVITTQPPSISIPSGTTALLSVTASGTAPLSYQWYEGVSGTTTSPVSGATSASFTTPALTADASYWVRVSNGAGYTDSQTATAFVLQTFASWVASNGLSGASAEANACPAGDGIPNLLKFALGLDPDQIASSGLYGLAQGNGALVFRYTRPTTITGISYIVETSTDLVNWDGVLATAVESNTTTTETCVATLPADQPRLFVRLVVSQP